MLHLRWVPLGFDSSQPPGRGPGLDLAGGRGARATAPSSNVGPGGGGVSARAHLCVRSRRERSFHAADEHPAAVALGTESGPFGKEVWNEEGGQRPRGIAGEAV